jgi:dephospho-CoA kinase
MEGGLPSWLVGITGGIGTGKSTLSRMCAEANAWPLLDADRYGHDGLMPGSPLLPELRARFGREVFAEDGGIDRPRLAERVFGDPTALADLNRVARPWIIERVRRELGALRARGYDDIILLDAALLIDWLDQLQPRWIVVVVAPVTQRLARLTAKGMSRGMALRRIRSQRGETGRLERADWVVENRGTLAELEAESVRLADRIRVRRRLDPGTAGTLASDAE